MEKAKVKSILKIILKVLCVLGILLAFCAFFSAAWYIKTFGKVGFSSILFTLFSNMKGTASGIVFNYLLNGLLPSLICGGIVSAIIFYCGKRLNFTFKNRKNDKNVQLYPLPSWAKGTVSLVLCVCLWISAVQRIELPSWAVNAVTKTKLYDTEYIDPKGVKITLPLKFFGESEGFSIYIKRGKNGRVLSDCGEVVKLLEEHTEFERESDMNRFYNACKKYQIGFERGEFFTSFNYASSKRQLEILLNFAKTLTAFIKLYNV